LSKCVPKIYQTLLKINTVCVITKAALKKEVIERLRKKTL